LERSHDAGFGAEGPRAYLIPNAIREYLEQHNTVAKPFIWTAAADVIFSEIVGHSLTNS